LIQIHNNTHIIGFYYLMHVSYTFAEAELEINFNNSLHTKRLASLYFLQASWVLMKLMNRWF